MKSPAARILLAVLVVTVVAACGNARVVKREGGRPSSAPAAAPAGSAIPRDGRYEVRQGDTLYGIAFRHGLDYREVARWNGIAPPYTIYPGQRLRLRSDAGPAAGGTSVTGMPAPRPATGTVATAPPRGPATPATTPATRPPGSPSGATTNPPVAANPPATTPVPPATPSPPLPSTPATGVQGAWRWPANGQVIGRFVAGDPKRQGLDIAGNAGDPVLAAADGVVVYSGAGLVGYGELIIVKHSDEWLSAYAHNRRRLVGEGAQVRAGQQIAELGRTGTSRDMLHFEVRRNGKPVDPLQVLPPR